MIKICPLTGLPIGQVSEHRGVQLTIEIKEEVGVLSVICEFEFMKKRKRYIDQSLIKSMSGQYFPKPRIRDIARLSMLAVEAEARHAINEIETLEASWNSTK